MVNIQNIRQVIKDKINKDIDWANPYWLDRVKEEAHTILDEQNSLTSANQNYLLQHLIEEKLELNSIL